MFKGDTVPGCFFIGFGLLFLFPSLGLGVASPTSDGVPGAGFFPTIMAVLLIVFGILLTINGIKSKGSLVYFEMDEEQKANVKPFFITMISICVFFALWKVIGFYFSVLIFCFFLNKVYQRNFKFNITYSILFTALIYFVFTVALKIQFTV